MMDYNVVNDYINTIMIAPRRSGKTTKLLRISYDTCMNDNDTNVVFIVHDIRPIKSYVTHSLNKKLIKRTNMNEIEFINDSKIIFCPFNKIKFMKFDNVDLVVIDEVSLMRRFADDVYTTIPKTIDIVGMATPEGQKEISLIDEFSKTMNLNCYHYSYMESKFDVLFNYYDTWGLNYAN